MGLADVDGLRSAARISQQAGCPVVLRGDGQRVFAVVQIGGDEDDQARGFGYGNPRLFQAVALPSQQKRTQQAEDLVTTLQAIIGPGRAQRAGCQFI